MHFVFLSVLLLQYGECKIWPEGVVHYAINQKDYDIHSQDEIMSTLAEIQKEICVKFFNTPLNYNATDQNKVLYISNPDKRKACPPEQYNFKGTVVDMPIGYKCVNQKDITRIVVDMLRASIEQTVSAINSNDLIRKFQAEEEDPSQPTLLSPSDRNYINAHYHRECGALSRRPSVETRRFSAADVELTVENEMYYKNKLWPLGIVMYGVEEKLRDSMEFHALKYAMTIIELASCVVFQQYQLDTVLSPKSILWFGQLGEESPDLGFTVGNQTISLTSMIVGAPGHTAHTLNQLMRALGIPMMSNRFDRDNYVTVNWRDVVKGKEHYLEKTPPAAWLADKDSKRLAYDFESVTHAAANYMCEDCSLGAQTVTPVQDHLWQRTLSMGHRTNLSAADKEMLNILYSKNCQKRYI